MKFFFERVSKRRNIVERRHASRFREYEPRCNVNIITMTYDDDTRKSFKTATIGYTIMSGSSPLLKLEKAVKIVRGIENAVASVHVVAGIMRKYG